MLEVFKNLSMSKLISKICKLLDFLTITDFIIHFHSVKKVKKNGINFFDFALVIIKIKIILKVF